MTDESNQKTARAIDIWAYGLAFWVLASLTSMAGMAIGSTVFVICSLFGIWQLRPRLLVLLASPFFLATVFFFLAAFLSLLMSWISPPLGIPFEGFRSLRKFHYFFLPFLVGLSLLGWVKYRRPLLEHPMFLVLLFMGAFISLVALVQFFGSHFFSPETLKHRFFREIPTGQVPTRFHGQGLMFFHLSFATAMSFVVSYALSRLVWPPKVSSGLSILSSRLPWVVLAMLSLAALFYSYSRIAWVALVAILVVVVALKRLRYSFFALIALGLFGSLLWFSSPSLQGRWKLGTYSFWERGQVWQSALAMVKDRPLTGVGFGHTGFYSDPYFRSVSGGEAPRFSSHAHNNLLDILAATGLVGFLAFAAWWLILLRYAFLSFLREPHNRWLSGGLIAAFVAFHINGLTQVNFFDAKSQHSLMIWAGLVLGLHWMGQKKSDLVFQSLDRADS
jgi:O-antigen ligase